MIVLPAIGVILQQIAQAAAIAGLIGGLVGGGAEAVSSIREHGEINHEVAVNVINGVGKGATGGALGGAGVAAVGIILAPAIPVAGVLTGVQAPVTVVDDVVAPVAGTLDDVAKSAVGRIKDASAVARSAVLVDDTASPVLSGVKNVAKSVASSVGSAVNRARNTLNARFYTRLPDASATKRYVYVMEDATNGLHKIGMTTKQPAVRLGKVSKDAKSKLEYVCIIRTDKNSKLESALHNTFSSQKTPHPTPNYDSIEWFALSTAQVVAACSR